MQLLQEIRADSSGKNLYLSAAVGLTTFIGYDGNPSANLSGFAAVLDHVTVKAYDINVGIHVSHRDEHLIIFYTAPMVHWCCWAQLSFE